MLHIIVFLFLLFISFLPAIINLHIYYLVIFLQAVQREIPKKSGKLFNVASTYILTYKLFNAAQELHICCLFFILLLLLPYSLKKPLREAIVVHADQAVLDHVQVHLFAWFCLNVILFSYVLFILRFTNYWFVQSLSSYITEELNVASIRFCAQPEQYYY